MRIAAAAAALALSFALSPASAQQSPYAEYQRMAAENSPVELYVALGEDAWRKPQGPNHLSLERCDLGEGPGVLRGAYAALPRYFADADRVMDLEARLLHCMTTLQGRSREEATKRVFGNADTPSEMEVLSAYVASLSRGMPLKPGTSHPKEKAAYETGRQLFFHRAGPWDFSCASCHGREGVRIRQSELPVLSEPKYARPLIATWPAYRVSNSQFVTMEWRMNDCYRQMRMPEPTYASDLPIALITYLTVNAQGATYRGPSIKR
jgi:L-cysteine S-thiosulfotransferase